ncbi:MAG TPA: UDP-glucose/GDP-mannose dehydrogenase family protein, partial [Candidatus Woesearchaeota archaeon]|nr:UDP-glucose/GDP-mannose dehydrogenase family protein [Candidatus Woesearchaeota archaeon]
MKVAVIGTGYVGLVAGAMFAKVGNSVVCVDKDETKINILNRGEIPIYEPGLKQIVLDARDEGLIEFTTDINKIKPANVIFLAVGTPSSDSGEFNLDFIKAAAKEVALAIKDSKDFKVIVVKSTVPPGTSETIRSIVRGIADKVDFAVVSNPEFLKEGKAVDDFESPDRIVIGTDSEKAKDIMANLYEPFSIKKQKLIFMKPVEAELTKLFSNTFLASKIALINEFAEVCSAFGADIMRVRNGVCSDRRIGWEFMYPSSGYGGSCFPKDIKGLVFAVKQKNLAPKII